MHRFSYFFLIIVVFSLSLTAQSQTATWITGLTVSTTATTASFSWSTVVPSSGMVRYGLTASYNTHTTYEPAASTSHVTSLTNLAAGTLYHFRLVAKDSTDASVATADATFTTPSNPVTVTISPATGTLASGGTEQFSAQVQNTNNQNVTWTASTGTITSAGLFTAPVVSTAQIVTITATSIADPTKSASASWTINPPVQHTVLLQWNASTSSDVVSYNAYRSITSGGPYALVGSAINNLSYADATVQSGLTYYYVVTAYDQSGAESTDSSQAIAVVPSP